jgi:hypothetical protein
MPVTVTPVAKPVAGIDFPVNHETFPNDCESVGCTKIEGRYRPGSWVLITNEYDEYEEENFEVENFVCTECSEKCKRSFNGQKVLNRKEVMPVLKEKVLIKGDIAVSKPLAWVMRPKKEVPKDGTNDTDKNHIGTNEEGPRETYGKENCKNRSSNRTNDPRKETSDQLPTGSTSKE